MLTCFGYWAAVSSVIYTMAYIFLCDLSFVVIAATLGTFQGVNCLCDLTVDGSNSNFAGYALTGHCIVLAATALFHPAHDHLFFFGLVLVFAGLSCLRMVCFPESGSKFDQKIQGIFFASKTSNASGSPCSSGSNVFQSS